MSIFYPFKIFFYICNFLKYHPISGIFKHSNFEVLMGFEFGLNVILSNVVVMARTVVDIT